MSLISAANLKTLSDKIGASYDMLRPILGLSANVAAPVAGTAQNLASQLLDAAVSLGNYEQESDIAAGCNTVLQAANVEAIGAYLQAAITAINGHCQKRGSAVDASIKGLTSYLTYLNTTPSGTPYAALLSPGFAKIWLALQASSLPAAGVFSPGISPDLDSTYTNGMGRRPVGGAFVAGTAPDLTKYAPVVPVVVVTTDFANGSAPATVTIAGTDDTGATTTTWTLTLDSDNPVSALATTITPAVTAQARQVVALGSTSGVAPGSVLVVNSGLPDQETVIAEAVGGGNLTAVFQKAHLAGATLTGKRTYATTPSVGTRRCRSVSGITIGVTGHDAGAVRVEGRQDRVPV